MRVSDEDNEKNSDDSVDETGSNQEDMDNEEDEDQVETNAALENKEVQNSGAGASSDLRRPNERTSRQMDMAAASDLPKAVLHVQPRIDPEMYQAEVNDSTGDLPYEAGGKVISHSRRSFPLFL